MVGLVLNTRHYNSILQYTSWMTRTQTSIAHPIFQGSRTTLRVRFFLAFLCQKKAQARDEGILLSQVTHEQFDRQAFPHKSYREFKC